MGVMGVMGKNQGVFSFFVFRSSAFALTPHPLLLTPHPLHPLKRIGFRDLRQSSYRDNLLGLALWDGEC